VSRLSRLVQSRIDVTLLTAFTDYDMCTSCITNKRDQHSSAHQFFRIEEPGHVIVHTVFGGEDDHVASRFPRAPPPQPAAASTPAPTRRPAPPAPVAHNATCDLCDSRIYGERFVSLFIGNPAAINSLPIEMS
jgi:next-to-BRCA1 protein 1